MYASDMKSLREETGAALNSRMAYVDVMEHEVE